MSVEIIIIIQSFLILTLIVFQIYNIIHFNRERSDCETSKRLLMEELKEKTMEITYLKELVTTVLSRQAIESVSKLDEIVQFKKSLLKKYFGVRKVVICDEVYLEYGIIYLHVYEDNSEYLSLFNKYSYCIKSGTIKKYDINQNDYVLI